MSLFGSPSTRQLNAGLVILRLILGTVFAAHGAQKLFVYGLAGVTGAFGQMGVPLPAITAPLVMALELAGGLALVLGVLTRPIALLLAFNMLGAILLVHLKGGFFLPNGIEFALTLLGGAALLVAAGAGSVSIDARIAQRSGRAERGAARTPSETRRAA